MHKLQQRMSWEAGCRKGRGRNNHGRSSPRTDPRHRLAVTQSGGLHAELNNEPSIEPPGSSTSSASPGRTQEAVRRVLNTIWTNSANDMPGNDDFGEMSSWCVWSAMGIYPQIPGRAELVLGRPLSRAYPPSRRRHRHPSTRRLYQRTLRPKPQAKRKPTTKTWLPAKFVEQGGTLDFELNTRPNKKSGNQRGGCAPVVRTMRP
jgi:putative alpha-1,2-mannosidase